MKKFFSIITLVALIICPHLSARIIETDQLHDVLIHLDEANEDTLIIFDIDNTLAAPAHELGSDQWFTHMYKKKMAEGMSVNEAIDAVLPLYYSIHFSIMLEPVEEIGTYLVRNLQAQGIKVIALTARSLPLMYRTIQQLAHIGIDFSCANFVDGELSLDLALPSKYKNGIVFCGNNDKGYVLLHFFDLVGFHPRKVIMVDDKLKNIAAVEKALEERGIEFVGLRYSRVDNKVENFDDAAADMQLHEFMQSLQTI